MAAGNPNFDTIASTTLRNYRKTLQDNLVQQQVLAFKLDSMGLVTEDEGGTSINQPIVYAENDTVKSYDGYDLIDMSPQGGITQAQYAWKYIVGSVVISGQEEFENQGTGRIINLLEAKLEQLETSARLEFGDQLYGDGTGNGGKDITGLAVAVEDGAAWSTYGGIDSSDSDNSWWRNQWIDFDASNTSFGTASGSSVEGLDEMRNLFLSASRGNTKPDLIITTQDIFAAYEAHIEGDKQRITDTSLGDAGFMNLAYKGVPVVFDDDLEAGEMLMLNTKFMKFVFGRGRRFKVTEFRRAQNQDARFAHLFIAGNLVTKRRDVQGRLSDIVV